jgi:carotenoid cleavage dioxygenase-like enzyme
MKGASPAELPVEQPAYMHSFGMSEDHLVLTEFPLVVNPLDLRVSGKPFIQNYHWEPERGLRFHVVTKDKGKLVSTAVADASFAFHHVNAFMDRDRLRRRHDCLPGCGHHRSALSRKAARERSDHGDRHSDALSYSACGRRARHAPNLG